MKLHRSNRICPADFIGRPWDRKKSETNAQHGLSPLPSDSPRATRIESAARPKRRSQVTTILSLTAYAALALYWNQVPPTVYHLPLGVAHVASTPHGNVQRVPSYPVSPQFSLDAAHFILISKDATSLTLYPKVRAFPIATGKNPGNKQRVGDCRTPETPIGTLYSVASKLYTPEMSPFGSRFMGLSTPPWRGIAIHGTNDPKSIGANASHGCVRLACPDIRKLFDEARIGDSVVITQ